MEQPKRLRAKSRVVKCCKCGAEIKQVIIPSVNAANRERRDALLDSSLFDVVCKCGATSRYFYSIDYVDFDKLILLRYAPALPEEDFYGSGRRGDSREMRQLSPAFGRLFKRDLPKNMEMPKAIAGRVDTLNQLVEGINMGEDNLLELRDYELFTLIKRRALGILADTELNAHHFEKMEDFVYVGHNDSSFKFQSVSKGNIRIYPIKDFLRLRNLARGQKLLREYDRFKREHTKYELTKEKYLTQRYKAIMLAKKQGNC
jgi:hypothetical protein